MANYTRARAFKGGGFLSPTRVSAEDRKLILVNNKINLTESELKAVCDIMPSNQEVNYFIKIYLKAYHDTQLTLKDDSETRPILQAGMAAGPKLEVVHKTPKII